MWPCTDVLRVTAMLFVKPTVLEGHVLQRGFLEGGGGGWRAAVLLLYFLVWLMVALP